MQIIYSNGGTIGGTMRAILGLIIAAAVLWGGYWFWGASRAQSFAKELLSEQGATGEVSVIGFPNRFDVTVTNPAFNRDKVAYSAPFFQVFAMTWKPWHLIAAFAPNQVIHLSDQTITLSSPHLLASLLMNPLGAFAPRELRVDGTKVALASSYGWHIDAAHVTAAIDANGAPLSPRVGGRLTDFTAPVPVTGLQDLIELASFDATLDLQRPLDRVTSGVQVSAVEIHDARINWGDFGLTAKGKLAPDAQGNVSGDISISLQGADHLPQILGALGLITSDQTATLAKGLAVMEGAGQITISLSGGEVRIGPFPVGVAPAWPH